MSPIGMQGQHSQFPTGFVLILVVVVVLAALWTITQRKKRTPGGQRSSPPAVGMTEPTEVESLTRRYKDAYGVARFTVTAGGLVKTLGVITSGLVGIITLMMAKQLNDQSQQAALFLAGAVVAAFLGGLIFLLGILISAQGQALMASLDSAVNTSPFLGNTEKAQIMSLKQPSSPQT